MNPKYYFIANERYYPSSGMGDWHGPFEGDIDYIESLFKTFVEKQEGDFFRLMKVYDNTIHEIRWESRKDD